MSRRTSSSSPLLRGSMSRRSGGDGQSPHSASPASAKRALDWVPIEKHPLFSNRTRDDIDVASGTTTTSSSSVLQNILAWDVASSRIFLWDAGSKFVHRLAVRFRDLDPVSSTSSSSVVMEAAFPSEILSMDIVVQATVHQISLNMDGSALLLSGSEGLSVMYLSEKSHTIADKISVRTVLLGSRLFSSHNNGLRILQASWHPYSNNHLGVLSSDSVLRSSLESRTRIRLHLILLRLD